MSIVCFGEVLWDVLPTRRFPGGASLNVAYHLHQLGMHPFVVSAVGRDALGDELRQCLRRWGLDVAGITSHRDLPTGRVGLRLFASGDAHYFIAPDVAWDQIVISDVAMQAIRQARALVFGSLSQRSRFNRATLDLLFSQLRPEAERVFDVNLRPPHDDLARVRQRAAHATVLKMNIEEAVQFATGREWSGLHEDSPGNAESSTARLARSIVAAWVKPPMPPPTICITAADRGAGLLHEGRWYWEEGRRVDVADTVGAGDAFLAAFLAARLEGLHPQECLARGCRLGEWVASRPGATPPHPETDSSRTDNEVDARP